MARSQHDIADHAERLASGFTAYGHEAAGRRPVVIQLHGCGGRQPMHDTYARAVAAAGYASLVVDSFTPRGISRRAAQMTVCTGLRLWGRERAVDVFAAIHWLRAQSWADPDRIVVAGWSHGAWAAMDAFAIAETEAQQSALDQVRAAFLVYPYAGAPSLTFARGWGRHKPKVAAVIGTRDAVVGRVAPRRALERLERDGLDVQVLELEGATHAFDDPDADDPRTRYDAALTQETHAFLLQSLSQAFG